MGKASLSTFQYQNLNVITSGNSIID